MALIDQALLGYRNGHRLLAASRTLPREAESALVAASDVPVSKGRVVLGMPLPDTDVYALCATWSAPTISRPGAVWAHALIATAEAFAQASSAALLSALGGNGRDLFDPFDCSKPAQIPFGDDDERQLCPSSMLEVVRAAYAAPSPVARVQDNRVGEIATLALWRDQWVSLRRNFAFRVNEGPRRAYERDVDLVVTAFADQKVEISPRDVSWTDELATELAQGTPGPLRHFLATFGPLENARPASVRGLGRLWSLVNAQAVEATAELVQARYAVAEEALELKLGLFGRSGSWWDVSEQRRLAAVLGSASGGSWPLDTLGTAERVSDLARSGQLPELLEILDTDLPPASRDALLSGAEAVPAPEVLATVVEWDSAAGIEMLKASGLHAESMGWRALPAEVAEEALRATQLVNDPEALSAAVIGGHADLVVRAADVRTVRRVISGLSSVALEDLAHDRAVRDLISIARPQDVLRFALAGASVDPRLRREALQAARRDADEVWLRIAAQALIEDPGALSVVFGPLHLSITEDRLPRELWADIGQVMPLAKDPAQRLRRLLVVRARAENWPQSQIVQALRGAGPHAGEVLRDLDRTDPLTKALKRALKRIRKSLS